MSNKIEKIAVLGAGTMGAQIAGHFSNAGIPSLLFDINPELAQKGVDGLTKLISSRFLIKIDAIYSIS